jgi:predicted 3-demethylubiquinone-9 3-methyltransferase (glyoxalase superfamily)
MQKINPFLWFENQAEEAARFYISLFRNSKIIAITRYGEAGPGPNGSVMTVSFEIEGQKFVALNGGRQAQFTEAISFVVNCTSQREVDEYWKKLTDGGEEIQCGWLKDRYSVSWQIVPTVLFEMLQDKDAERTQRVMRAMFPMKKLDIAALEAAYQHSS